MGRGCMMLVIFILLLAGAFFIGGYYGVRYVVTSTEPREIPAVETTEAEQQAVRERWEQFKESARSAPPPVQTEIIPPVESATPTPPGNRIVLTASDINQLIAAGRNTRGKAFVSIENNVALIQVSIPLEKAGFKGRFLNGTFQVRAAPDGNPRNLEVTEVSMGGVSDKVLNALLGFRSVRDYADQYASEYGVTSVTIQDNKAIIDNGGRAIPGFNR